MLFYAVCIVDKTTIKIIMLEDTKQDTKQTRREMHTSGFFAPKTDRYLQNEQLQFIFSHKNKLVKT